MSDEGANERLDAIHFALGERAGENALTPETKREIYSIVQFALTEHAERACNPCALGIPQSERELVRDLLHVVKETTPRDVRENHEFVIRMRRASEKVGMAIILTVVLAATGGIIAAVTAYLRGSGSN